MGRHTDCYARVSTPGQADEGVSLEAQQRKMEVWCALHDADLQGLHVDAGLSGSCADNRPALQAALTEVTRHNGVLLVYSLSRLARSNKDTLIISERLERAGADLVSLSEKIDTTTGAGKMVFRMFAVLSEFERDRVAERTTAAMAHMRDQNKFLGPVPLGFELADDVRTPVSNTAEQEAVRLIRQLREKGLSLRKIAVELEVRWIPTKAGGSSWTHTAVKSILART